MGIILKYAIKNIWEKKGRTFLILLSIALSSALLFASLAISDTMEQMYVEQFRKFIGTAEIAINANRNSPSSFFYTRKAERFSDELEYVVGTIQTTSTYRKSPTDSIQFYLYGYKLGDLQKMNPATILGEHQMQPFAGKKLIIGQLDAEEYGLSLGSKIDLKIGGNTHRFVVAGITASDGLFRPVKDGISVVVPRETLAAIYDARGHVTRVYAKTKDEGQLQNLIARLQAEYSDYSVSKTITRGEIREAIKPMTTSFLLMLIMVVFVSVFIIYTSFKVITMERLPIIGTFRSIGATRKMTDILLMSESISYGVIGGAAGCGLGIGLLNIMMKVMADNPYTQAPMKAQMVFGAFHVLTAFLFAVILSLVSSALPIIKVAKLPVRDIVLNTVASKSRKGKGRLIAGTVMLVVAVVLPSVITSQIAMLVDSLCIILAGVGVVLLIPIVTNVLGGILQRCYRFIFGNEGILAAKNLRNNRSLINNIALLTIGVGSLIMINIVSHSVSVEVMNAYHDAHCDILAAHDRADRTIEQKIRTVKGVVSTYGIYEAFDVEVVGTDKAIGMISGVDARKYDDYWSMGYLGDKEKVLSQLDEGRNIVLNTVLAERFGANVGDTLTLDMERGQRQYQIIGLCRTLISNGDMALVSERNLRMDMALQYKAQILVKVTGDPEAIKTSIKEKFSNDYIWVSTLDEMEEKNSQANQQMFGLLKGFSLIAMLIGAVGILNNYIVGFISRKRSFAILRSVGMSKRQVIKMLLVESMSGGLIGGVAGMVCGSLFLCIASFVMRAMSLPVAIHYSVPVMANGVIGGVLISIVASLSPTIKSSKLNIVKAIKYE